MILINSGEYIDQELESEIGKIPPSFLPLKNMRLYKHQIRSLKNGDSTFISIPIDYAIPLQDLDFFTSNRIQTIKIPKNKSLGESVFFSLEIISNYSNEVTILHGDTLVLDSFEFTENTYVISPHLDNYNWGAINTDSGLVYAGLFHIKNIKKFRECLLKSEFNFIEALTLYKKNEIINFIESQNWFDFGHVNTFYRSRASMPALRYFNKMTINNNIVIKSSNNNLKIFAEANWFNSFPVEFRYYLPQWLGLNDDPENPAYKIEYQYLITLNELYVFGEQKYFIWKKVIDSCFRFLKNINSFKKDDPGKNLNNDIFLTKTKNRILEFLAENPYLSGKLFFQGEELGSLIEIAEEVNQIIPLPTREHISVVHGDFCFSNIFFDYKKQEIKVIDPRGLNDKNEIEIYGDIRYDYSKLAHSLIGYYDQIVAENYIFFHDNLNFSISFHETKMMLDIQEYFWAQIDMIDHVIISRKIVLAGIINLFISMLPLHKESNSRQMALIANALRLYKNFKK